MKEKELEIWKIAINTQMHFNDLIMKIRAIVTSLITAIFGAAAFSLKEARVFVYIIGKEIHISAFIILIGIVFLLAYLVLDFCYYFRLLLGAVNCSAEIEKRNKNFNLTTNITKRVSVPRAYASLAIFYSIIILIGIGTIIFIFFASPNLR